MSGALPVAAAWTGLAALALALAISVATDLRSRLVLNLVTLPALAVVLLCAFVGGGRARLVSSLLGVLACAGPFLLASLPGWIGMGDVKLMAVVGAALGWPVALAALFWVTVAGGVQAALQLLVARVRGAEKPRYVPYACAIAAGTLAAFFFGVH